MEKVRYAKHSREETGGVGRNLVILPTYFVAIVNKSLAKQMLVQTRR